MQVLKQPRFEFPVATEFHLLNVNTRKELHGEEHVQAVDLSFKVDMPNTVLDDVFSPRLREALYFNAAAEAGQEVLDGVEKPLPNLLFGKLNGQKFNWGGKDKLVGYTLRMEYGLGDDLSNIELELCKVYGRTFETKEGGTVTVHFKVSNASDRLDKDTCGKLVLLGGEQVTMSLIAPVVEQTEKTEETQPENPFTDPDPKPLDNGTGDLLGGSEGADGKVAWPFPNTPEQALEQAAGAAA